MTPRIALVLGDPAGIGSELAARLLADTDLCAQARILVVGDRRLLAAGERIAGVRLGLEPGEVPGEAPRMLDLANADPAAIPAGVASAEGGRATLENLRTALGLFKRGVIDAICFVPFNKEALKLGGNRHEDELALIAEELGADGPYGEFNVMDSLWNARVTSHVPLSGVAELITRERILDRLQLTDRTMRKAGFATPRIAVAALNPHAGDGGNFGREEIEVIGPAVERARALGLTVDGPYPSDTVFLRARDGRYDAVLTMYHDQGQIAIKLMGFDRGVTVLGGLPVPITTPAHGTAYDIAGRGIANPEPTRRAFALACAMAESRPFA
jgi:4-hydroxythreonine-4-phosphate dehydrogenase